MSQKILDHFKKADPVFYQVVLKVHKAHGDEIFNLTKHEFLFDRLVESIVSQQLSVKASDSIYKRVIDLMPGKKLTPEGVLKNKDEDLRKAGLSFGKIKYIKDLSEKVIRPSFGGKTGELDLDNLENLENENVIEELTKVKGIGKWTAEMFLMSALGRPDIFSHGDLGLKNAIKKIYNLEKYDPFVVEEIVIKWSPYKTFACRILWKSLAL